MSFLGEAARKMIAKFNASETPLADLPVEFMLPANHSPNVADQPPQVINKDSPAVTVGGADKDENVM